MVTTRSVQRARPFGNLNLMLAEIIDMILREVLCTSNQGFVVFMSHPNGIRKTFRGRQQFDSQYYPESRNAVICLASLRGVNQHPAHRFHARCPTKKQHVTSRGGSEGTETRVAHESPPRALAPDIRSQQGRAYQRQDLDHSLHGIWIFQHAASVATSFSEAQISSSGKFGLAIRSAYQNIMPYFHVDLLDPYASYNNFWDPRLRCIGIFIKGITPTLPNCRVFVADSPEGPITDVSLAVNKHGLPTEPFFTLIPVQDQTLKYLDRSAPKSLGYTKELSDVWKMKPTERDRKRGFEFAGLKHERYSLQMTGNFNSSHQAAAADIIREHLEDQLRVYE